MSLLALHSFGNYNSYTFVPEDRNAISVASGAVVITSPSRYTGFTRGIGIGRASTYFSIPIEGVTFPIYFGYGLFLDHEAAGFASAFSSYDLGHVSCLSPATGEQTGGVESLGATLTPAGFVSVLQRLSDTTDTSIAVSEEAIQFGTWHWIEISLDMDLIHEGDCRVIVKVDGVQVIDITGDVYSPASHSVDWRIPYSKFVMGPSGSGSGDYIPIFTDFYMCDSAGSSPFNTWLGEITIESLRPNGDSATYAEWSLSAGGSHYALVDEAPPNDDTDYVYADPDKKDAYTYPDLANTSGVIKGVQLMGVGRQVEPFAAYKLDGIVRRAGVDGLVTAVNTKANSLTPYNAMSSRVLLETDPTDSSTWTIAKVNAAEFGPRRPA